MKIDTDRYGGVYQVAERKEDLAGWETFFIGNYKEGVKLYHQSRSQFNRKEMRIVYVPQAVHDQMVSYDGGTA